MKDMLRVKPPEKTLRKPEIPKKVPK